MNISWSSVNPMVISLLVEREQLVWRRNCLEPKYLIHVWLLLLL